MILHIILIVYSVILLCVLMLLSITGMTIFDAIVYSNYEDATTIINNSISELITNKTSNRVLYKSPNGHFLKTSKVAYDLRTDTITFDKTTLPLSSKSSIALFFLPTIVQN